MSQRTSEMTLTKVVTVEIPVEDAFRLYTEGIATWWPHATHSVAAENVEEVVFEAREGGRIYERAKSGEEHLWGTVVAVLPQPNHAHLAPRAGWGQRAGSRDHLPAGRIGHAAQARATRWKDWRAGGGHARERRHRLGLRPRQVRRAGQCLRAPPRSSSASSSRWTRPWRRHFGSSTAGGQLVAVCGRPDGSTLDRDGRAAYLKHRDNLLALFG